MNRLSTLFSDLPPWITEIESKVNYSDPILGIDHKYHYLYCYVNLSTRWCYIGKHTSDNPYNLEGYLGSSGNNLYWIDRDRYEFEFVILDYYLDSNALSIGEANLISDDLLTKYSNNGLYNLTLGGNGGDNLHIRSVEILHRQTWVIHNIQSRIIKLKSLNLELTPQNYYYLGTELEVYNSHFHRDIQTHIESVTDRLYDDPPITDHEEWEPEWTDLFRWFDNEDNWKSISVDITLDKQQTNLIRSIKSRFKMLVDLNLPITQENYFYVNFNDDYGDSKNYHLINLHLNAILSRLTNGDDSISNHPDWVSSWTEFFEWYRLDSNLSSLLIRSHFGTGYKRLINKTLLITEFIKLSNLEFTPEAYYAAYLSVIDLPDPKISFIRHVLSVCEYIYMDPSIKSHPLWNHDLDQIFDFFDNSDNWSEFLNQKINK